MAADGPATEASSPTRPEDTRASLPLDALPCGIVSFGDDGIVTVANATLATMAGRAPADIEGRHVEQLLGIPGRIFFQTHLYPLVRLHGRAEEIFVLLRRPDGSDVGTLMNAVRQERGGRAVVDCVFIEVKERRKFEDALVRARQAADEARAVLEERTEMLEAANERMHRQQVILEEQAVELEVQHQHVQEQAAELEARGEELQAMNEELQEANDELLRHGEELEQARAEADRANHAKSEFLAVMSHELRTPLNAIGGYVQLLELEIHGPVTDAQRGAFERITRAQRHLLRLINEVLNLARIEAGHVEYRLEAVPVASLVAAVLPMIEPQMATAGLASACRLDPRLVAIADAEKAQQILLNLLTNAVKFTGAGGTITVVTEAAPAGDEVLVRVTDTGIGIPADRLTSVFDPFVQVDSGRTRRIEGTGLGLAISRDLARGMGGDLTAESALGRGSTFTLRLPAG